MPARKRKEPAVSASSPATACWPEGLETQSIKMTGSGKLFEIFREVAKYASRTDWLSQQMPAAAVMASMIWVTVCTLRPTRRGAFTEYLVCLLLNAIVSAGCFKVVNLTFDILGSVANDPHRTEVKSSKVFYEKTARRLRLKIKFSWRQRVAIYLGLIHTVAIVVWNAPVLAAEILFVPAAAFKLSSGSWRTDELVDGVDDADEAEETAYQVRDEADPGADFEGEDFEKHWPEAEKMVRSEYNFHSPTLGELAGLSREEALEAGHGPLLEAITEKFVGSGHQFAQVTIDFSGNESETHNESD